jgi:uncharacterized protein (DUF305 family)
MKSHYGMLALNLIASAIVMYFVMFAMIDGVDDFYNNINMAYMALAMVAPMGILMLATMGHMYPNRTLNTALYLGFAGLFAVAVLFTRTQAFVGDAQFLRSMIPHHSGAVLMCREAPIEDAEIAALCTRIIESQREEIDQMRRIQARLAQGS